MYAVFREWDNFKPAGVKHTKQFPPVLLLGAYMCLFIVHYLIPSFSPCMEGNLDNVLDNLQTTNCAWHRTDVIALEYVHIWDLISGKHYWLPKGTLLSNNFSTNEALKVTYNRTLLG